VHAGPQPGPARYRDRYRDSDRSGRTRERKRLPSREKAAPNDARLAEHSRSPAEIDPDYVARHRAWIAAQPGFCGGYHLLEPETGRALSLTMWEDDDALAAAERALRAGRGPADGRLSRESQPTVRLAQVAAVF
jgi:heme-degrading monooxygenase HmoA